MTDGGVARHLPMVRGKAAGRPPFPAFDECLRFLFQGFLPREIEDIS